MVRKMLIFVCIALVLAVVPSPSLSQSAYEDALDLERSLKADRKTFKASDFNNVINILLRYTDLGDEATRRAVVGKFDKNPFISATIDTAAIKISQPPGLEAFSPSVVEKGIESVGGINVTNFAGGLAKFLVARAKHELGASFFKQFKEELEKAGDLRRLFPETFKVLMAIEDNVFNYQLYLAALRESFEKDLAGLLDNVPEFVDWHLARAQAGSSKAQALTTVRDILRAARVIAQGLNDGTHPGDILAVDELQTALAAIHQNAGASLAVFNVFSRALRSSDPKHYWVELNSLKQFDYATLMIFLGLMYQSVDKDIEWVKSDGTKVKFKGDVLSNLAKQTATSTELAQLKSTLDGILYDAHRVESYLQLLRPKNTGDADLTYQDYHKYIDACLDLLEHAMNLSEMAGFKPADDARDFLDIVRVSSDLGVDLRTSQYSSAVINATTLLDKLFEEKSLNDDFKKRRDKIIKYGTFMATVAGAENSDQVHDAIEAVALPPGSASIKRKTNWNVSVNAYLGASMGKEEFNGEKKDAVAGWAPVGIAVSKGMRASNKEFGSLTVFVTVIDVGAVTTYRLNDDSTSTLPKLELRNIFAPGAAVIWGVPWWSAVSIGGGYQLGPDLRAIKEGAVVTEDATRRFHGFIAVDIPMFNLYTKPR